ncbi:MAG: hypothetical protein ACI9LM_003623 [Alteromonadaceae bacterium]|jgi:hypothetical protein
MSLSNEELLSNIKRQAKRLSKSINIPLRQAQSVLSISVYQCDNWNHLRDSLKSDSLENQLLLLSALQPNADSFLYKLLDNNLTNISFIIKENNSVDIPESAITEIVVNMFGIEINKFKEKINE